MGSKGLTISAAICPLCSSPEARLEVYSTNGISGSAYITCPGCGAKTKNLLEHIFGKEEE